MCSAALPLLQLTLISDFQNGGSILTPRHNTPQIATLYMLRLGTHSSSESKIMHVQKGFYFDTFPFASCRQHAANLRTTCGQHADNMRTTCRQHALSLILSELAKLCILTRGSILTRFLLHHADNMLRLVTHSSSEYEIMHDQRLNVTTQSSSVNSVRLFV